MSLLELLATSSLREDEAVLEVDGMVVVVVVVAAETKDPGREFKQETSKSRVNNINMRGDDFE